MPRPLPAHVIATVGEDHDAVRDHILDAALRVIVRGGLAAASTRAIAAEAGLGSGTLYNYFTDHVQLLAQSIIRRRHVLAEPLTRFPTNAGTHTVGTNLRLFAQQAMVVLDELVPLNAAAFADADLVAALRRERTKHDRENAGIHPVEQYLLAERNLGRVARDADCRAAASTLVGLCHDRAFHRFLTGESGPHQPLSAEIDLIVRAIRPRS